MIKFSNRNYELVDIENIVIDTNCEFSPKFIPINEETVQKLSDLLLRNYNGDTMDLIWGPEIELTDMGDSHENNGSKHQNLHLESVVPPDWGKV